MMPDALIIVLFGGPVVFFNAMSKARLTGHRRSRLQLSFHSTPIIVSSLQR